MPEGGRLPCTIRCHQIHDNPLLTWYKTRGSVRDEVAVSHNCYLPTGRRIQGVVGRGLDLEYTYRQLFRHH